MENQQSCDVVILGCGPAGLQAAIHAARRKTNVLVLGKMIKSAAQKAHIDNYCCLQEKAKGQELLEQGKKQAKKSGASFLEEDAINIQALNGSKDFRITLESKTTISTKAIIFALGISRNKLNVPGEKKFLGNGVSYCVDCDGFFYKDQIVTVIGNESASAAGALTLLMIAKEVHLIYQQLKVDDTLKDQISKSEIIEHPETWIHSINGNENVEQVVLKNDQIINTNGVFVELGAKGAAELAATLGVQLDPDQYKYIITDKKQKTNVPGIFAAGDICGPPWQVAKAVGEGCVAGLEAAAYAKEAKK